MGAMGSAVWGRNARRGIKSSLPTCSEIVVSILRSHFLSFKSISSRNYEFENLRKPTAVVSIQCVARRCRVRRGNR